VRALTVPIHALDRAAQKIASGDLSGEIGLAQNDELGDLARQMEIMRQQLRDAFQTAMTERNRYAAVIQSMGVATVITDNNLTIAAANLAAQSLLEQDATRLIGQSLNQILANGKDGNSQSVAWSLDDAIGDQGLVARGRFHLRTNLRAMLDVISTPVQMNGVPAGYVHVLRDAAAEEQMVRVKDEFMMNVAHELRGPLASLRASIELLVDDFAEMSRPDLGLMLRTMQRSVLKFQGLVENLVDVGTIQAGNFRVRPFPNRVEDLIEDALSQTQAMVQARQQTVETKFNCALPCLVSADRPRIMQVLINLITNASKYGPESEPILVSVSTQDRAAIIEVEDRGQGISPGEQENLFKRFYRGRRAEEEGIGIGLGLALAREIVTAHGGQIGVKSGLGKGTTFWFSLPLVK
jgi:signal transduction histidine kinase